MHRQPGDRIVLRYRTGGRLSAAIPVTVVADTPEYVALYRAVGTPMKWAMRLDGTPIPRDWPYARRHATPWRLGDAVWQNLESLMLARPGAAHAVSVFWDTADWSLRGWYIDLQAPLRRTPLGFDSEDQVLDIFVEPNGIWHWKDEDEFADAQRVSRFSAAQAAAIRSEAERVVEHVERWGWPFNAGWERWRPGPAWPIPTLPDGWERDGGEGVG